MQLDINNRGNKKSPPKKSFNYKNFENMKFIIKGVHYDKVYFYYRRCCKFVR